MEAPGIVDWRGHGPLLTIHYVGTLSSWRLVPACS
jgi:hypothetical protein